MLRMKLFTSKSIAGLLSSFLLAAPILTPAAHAEDQGTTQHHPVHHRSRKKAAPLILPPLPAGPLSQVPMDQMPAAAPNVTYENGLLSISAQNATLGDILRDVRKLTGANVEVPPAGANERVVVQLGPGAPRDVLAKLLNGTSFNYVMLGSASDPRSVATVVLSSKPGGEVQTAAYNPASVAQPPTPFQPPHGLPLAARDLPSYTRGAPVGAIGQGNPPQPAASDDESSDDESADDKDDDSDQAAQPQQPGQMVQPGMGQQPMGQPDNSQDQGNLPNAGPKSADQILQMIRDGQRPVPPGVPPNQQPPQD